MRICREPCNFITKWLFKWLLCDLYSQWLRRKTFAVRKGQDKWSDLTYSFSSMLGGDEVLSLSCSFRKIVTRATVCFVFSDSNDTFHWSVVAVAPKILTPDFARALQNPKKKNTDKPLRKGQLWNPIKQIKMTTGVVRCASNWNRFQKSAHLTTNMAMFCADFDCRNTGIWTLDNG